MDVGGCRRGAAAVLRPYLVTAMECRVRRSQPVGSAAARVSWPGSILLSRSRHLRRHYVTSACPRVTPSSPLALLLRRPMAAGPVMTQQITVNAAATLADTSRSTWTPVRLRGGETAGPRLTHLRRAARPNLDRAVETVGAIARGTAPRCTNQRSSGRQDPAEVPGRGRQLQDRDVVRAQRPARPRQSYLGGVPEQLRRSRPLTPADHGCTASKTPTPTNTPAGGSNYRARGEPMLVVMRTAPTRNAGHRRRARQA